MSTIIGEFQADWAQRAIAGPETPPKGIRCAKCQREIKGKAQIVGYQSWLHLSCWRANVRAMRLGR